MEREAEQAAGQLDDDARPVGGHPRTVDVPRTQRRPVRAPVVVVEPAVAAARGQGSVPL